MHIFVQETNIKIAIMLRIQMKSLYYKSKKIKAQESLCYDIKMTNYKKCIIFTVHTIHFNILLCVPGMQMDII